jgi:methylmalonyl-CoA/ethylmalonyl-CoA epimerase
MAILRIQHIGTALADFQGTWDACAQGLGMTPRDFRKDQGRGFQHDARILLGNDCWLHLVHNWREDARVYRYWKNVGVGLEHIAVQVDDIEAEVARLRAMKVPLWEDTILNAADGFEAFIFPDDAIGFTIELIQPHATSWGYPEDARGVAISSRLGVTRLDHVGCAVRDVRAAATRLSALLNLPHEFDVSENEAHVGFGNRCFVEIQAAEEGQREGLTHITLASRTREADKAVLAEAPALPFDFRVTAA